MVRTSDVKKGAVIYKNEDARTFYVLEVYGNNVYARVEEPNIDSAGNEYIDGYNGNYLVSELTGYTKDLLEEGEEEEVEEE